ncbi:hypothetical protein Ami103574_11630 [Aminipila butyrica]|uniref:Uncharacterized protein n=1 Tax=Aminipila butyrica TaxID=433296 RepID=A0A858BV53_9FIRM|nr:hypothetical protein [Aminipila butyrica]QIB69931.1 hypothetical protein Ami103574_11630 [Aminipila butyrica]
MKVFIAFLGIFLVSISAVVYQGDLGAYGQEQLLLKEAAEECAAGAALFLEEDAYAKGSIVFNQQQGQTYIKDYLAYIKRNSKALSRGTVSYEAVFEDEDCGYASENFSRIPAVTVDIRVATEDLFRLPFVKVTSLERRARYELPEESRK